MGPSVRVACPKVPNRAGSWARGGISVRSANIYWASQRTWPFWKMLQLSSATFVLALPVASLLCRLHLPHCPSSRSRFTWINSGPLPGCHTVFHTMSLILWRKLNCNETHIPIFSEQFQPLILSSWGPWNLRIAGSTKVPGPNKSCKSSSQYNRDKVWGKRNQKAIFFLRWKPLQHTDLISKWKF